MANQERHHQGNRAQAFGMGMGPLHIDPGFVRDLLRLRFTLKGFFVGVCFPFMSGNRYSSRVLAGFLEQGGFDIALIHAKCRGHKFAVSLPDRF